MTEEQLRAIEERCRKASNGPWITEAGEYSGRNWMIGMVAVHLGASNQDDKCHFVTTNNVHASELTGDAGTDAEFIAHAREDVPALIAEVRSLRAKLDAVPADAIRAIYDSVPVDNWTRKPLGAIRRWLASIGKQVSL